MTKETTEYIKTIRHIMALSLDTMTDEEINNCEEIIKLIKEQPRWIPCSDKMPDINIHVLAQFVMGGMAECYYAHNWWHIVGGFRISGDEVIAWQPLPQPYKAESEDE